MAKKFKMPTHETQIEALAHIPNLLALAAQMRPGGGAHRTDRGHIRFERRGTRNECRLMERGA